MVSILHSIIIYCLTVLTAIYVQGVYMNKKTQKDKTSAAKTSIGFDYQYYFFLWKLLSLRTGEKLGLEVLDDVHLEVNGIRYLYQIKHTIQQQANGSSINLSTYDSDLWKTLLNWLNLISDDKDGRGSIEEQLIFVKKTYFIIATNKTRAKNNIFIILLTDYQEGRKNFTLAYKELLELRDKTIDKEITKCIDMFSNFDKDVVKIFFENILFEFEKDEIFTKCRNAIKADKVPESMIDDVFMKIDSAIRKDNFLTIKKGNKILLSFDDYYLKYRKYYELARSPTLKIKPFDGVIPEKLEDQVFIRQLIDIEDIQEKDLNEILELTLIKLKLQINLDNWYQNGEITMEEIEEVKQEAIISWKNLFKSKYRNLEIDQQINVIALNILDELRSRKLRISGQELGTEISNGYFYKLSDEPRIGWRKDWESRYKK